ncbi:MAG: hypothetical protein KDA32_11030 [Phycisphaerales bacterium]|nr:hypothetical protein [Phycisphaerales bacterium]
MRTIQTILGIAAMLAIAAGSTAAPIGTAITYQGMLQDTGSPAQGLYDLRFRLYSAAIGGSQIGDVLFENDVPVDNGFFTVDLDFGASVYGPEARWLQIEAKPGVGGSYVTMTPRQPIMPAPVALYALNAGGGSGSGYWNANGSSIYKNNSGNVGIGTNTPQAPLEVRSRLRVAHNGGSGPIVALGTGLLELGSNSIGTDRPYGALHFLDGASATRAGIEYGPDGLFAPYAMRFQTNGVYRMHITDAGFVGIGTASPGLMLDVNGRARIRKGGNSSAGIFFWQDGVNEDRGFVGMANDNLIGLYGTEGAGWGLVMNNATGAIGCGTTSPTARVDVSHAGSIAIRGLNTSSSGSAYGLFGYSQSPTGIGCFGQGKYGVYGFSSVGGFDSKGVYALSNATDGAGLHGHASSGGRSAGVWGTNSGGGWAGFFEGSVRIDGDFQVTGSANFIIDNPLNPTEEYLFHSCVESDEMKNIYDGVATLDDKGQAEIRLPDWFDLVNADFRYQLTCVGGYAPVYVAAELKDNRFLIAGGREGLRVSWQVTGVRIDPAAQAANFQVVQRKPEGDRGTYLNPEAYGQSISLRAGRLANPHSSAE